ncbi:transposon ty3-I gag-pol polyprotein [Tanacetum coccineum]
MRQEGGGDAGSLLPRSMRLDVPKFSGTNPESYLFSINEYFTLLNTLIDQRLRIMGFNLKGEAAEWFRWVTQNSLITTWAMFEDSSTTVMSGRGSQRTQSSRTLTMIYQPARVSQSVKTPLLPTPTSGTSNETTKPLAIKWISPAKRQERLRVVERMKLLVTDAKPFKVYIGSGETLLCENLCAQVSLKIQGLRMKIDLYVLPMKGPNIVLGDDSLRRKQICLRHMRGLLETDDVYGVYELYSLTPEEPAQGTISMEGVAVPPP